MRARSITPAADGCSWPKPLAIAALVILSVTGCNDNGLRQVEGLVTVAGEPLTTGRIEFIPEQGRRSFGHIKSDGSYQLMTYETADGAKPGNYRVLIEAIETEGEEKIGKSIFDETSFSGSSFKQRSLVNTKYSSRASTPLTATVDNGKNQINFELEK